MPAGTAQRSDVPASSSLRDLRRLSSRRAHTGPCPLHGSSVALVPPPRRRCCCCNPAHTVRIHTHTRLTVFSGTTQVSRYQKGKINLDFTEARDSKWQWHQLGHMQVCTLFQTDNHTSTPPLLFFSGRMPFLPPNQQRQSTDIGYVRCNDVTESMVTIRSPFCGYNLA